MASNSRKQHPGTKIICNFAASGPLLQQIAQGAPVDVFASADQKTMNQAQEKGLIVPASRKNFVSNTLVLIVPEDSKLGSERPSRTWPHRRSSGWPWAIPPRVPVGRYTQEALTKAGLWEALAAQVYYGGIGAPGPGLCQPGRSGRGVCLRHRCGHCQGQGENSGRRSRGTNPLSIRWPWWRRVRSKSWGKNF